MREEGVHADHRAHAFIRRLRAPSCASARTGAEDADVADREARRLKMRELFEFDVSKPGLQSVTPTADQEPKISEIAKGSDSLEFLDAAKELAGEREAGDIIVRHMKPLYFLLCQSMELSMKAYLRSKGYDDERLKQAGHRLKSCA